MRKTAWASFITILIVFFAPSFVFAENMTLFPVADAHVASDDELASLFTFKTERPAKKKTVAPNENDSKDKRPAWVVPIIYGIVIVTVLVGIGFASMALIIKKRIVREEKLK